MKQDLPQTTELFMPTDYISGGGIVLLLLALFIIVSLFLGVRIVPQAQKYVV